MTTEVSNETRMADGSGVSGGVRHHGSFGIRGQSKLGDVIRAADLVDPKSSKQAASKSKLDDLNRSLKMAKITEAVVIGVGIIGIAVACTFLSGCAWLQKNETELTQVGTGILCVLEHEELDDEALNAACDKILGYLTPEQKTAVMAHAAANKAAKANKKVLKAESCAKDGGS